MSRTSCAAMQLCVLCLFAWTARQAQAAWPSNSAVNLAIADRPNEQSISHLAVTSDGGCYIVWLDNATGGYDTYLQRLDAQGNEQWAHNGVLVADTISFTSTQDHGLAVDINDNALLAYRDDRPGTVQIGVNKVSPAGVLLWGANGVIVSTSANGNSPHNAALSDGSSVVGWSISNTIRLQRVDANGVPQWTAGGITISESGRSLNLSDLQPGDNGSVIALWQRCDSTNCVLSNKHLYVQKYDSSGNPLWNAGSPLLASSTTGLQLGYFPVMIPDGSGGVVYCWYDTGGVRNCFAQHIAADGTLLLGPDGAAANTTANVTRTTPWCGYDPVANEIFMAWTQSNSVQSMFGLYAQKFNGAGARQWADTGVEILPLTANQNSYTRVVAYQGGAVVTGFDSRSTTTRVVIATRLDADGQSVWSPPIIQPCSLVNGKDRLNIARNACDVLLTWSDPRSGAHDIYAQNVRADGSLGLPPALLGDLDCSGTVDLGDIVPFAQALTSASAFQAAHPCCPITNADMDASGSLNGGDVQGFVAALLGV